MLTEGRRVGKREASGESERGGEVLKEGREIKVREIKKRGRDLGRDNQRGHFRKRE